MAGETSRAAGYEVAADAAERVRLVSGWERINRAR
jgi:hypothetical protein